MDKSSEQMLGALIIGLKLFMVVYRLEKRDYLTEQDIEHATKFIRALEKAAKNGL